MIQSASVSIWTSSEARYIYHLSRENKSYDEATDMVVIAKDSREARQLAAARAADEGAEAWLRPSQSSIQKIGLARKPNANPPASRVVVCDGSWCG